MNRFAFMGIAAILAASLLIAPASLWAQPYPNRPIQLVNPGNPGFMLDVSCRIIAEEMGKILGTQMIVLNKPGASQTRGTDFVVRSKKDGYTLLYAGNTPLVNAPITNPKAVPYDPLKDLEPLGGQVIFPFTVNVREDSPWKTFKELADHAKKHPGELRVGSPGIGSTDNLNLGIVQSLTGAQFTHVPLSGTNASVQLLGGHIEVGFGPITEVSAHVKAGKLRLLLVSTKLPQFPDVPTITDLGYRQGLIYGWFAFFAPAGIPEEGKKILVPALEKAVNNPEVKTKVEKLEFFVRYLSPADLRKSWSEEFERTKALAAQMGIAK